MIDFIWHLFLTGAQIALLTVVISAMFFSFLTAFYGAVVPGTWWKRLVCGSYAFIMGSVLIGGFSYVYQNYPHGGLTLPL